MGIYLEKTKKNIITFFIFVFLLSPKIFIEIKESWWDKMIFKFDEKFLKEQMKIKKEINCNL
jgi:hypothetical protein